MEYQYHITAAPKHRMERTPNTQTHELIALRDAALIYLILSSDSFDADGDKTFGWRIGHG
jgi:hypothetical protein